MHLVTPTSRSPYVRRLGESLLAARASAIRLRRRLAARQSVDDVSTRLVRDPVFILCSVRSGSTLLRAILNSHSRIHAPHEMHFSDLRVSISTSWARKSMTASGLDELQLENILWDRLLYGMLSASGKEMIVDKTPQNAAQWGRVHKVWPNARYIHLRRHPAAILRSRIEANSDMSPERNLELLNRYGDQLDAARAVLPGPTVRYEDLVAAPAEVTQRVCSYLGVPWEAGMLDYRVPASRERRSGLGDWSNQIKSGAIQEGRPVPDDAPAELADLIARWQYS